MAIKTRTLSHEEKKKLTRLILLLFVLGAISLILKNSYYTETHTSSGDQLWILGIDTALDYSEHKNPVYIARPSSTRHVRVIGENILHPGLLIKREKSTYSKRKELIVTPSQNGTYQLSLEYKLHFSPTSFLGINNKSEELSAEQRQYYLKDEPGLDMEHPEVDNILARLSINATDKNDLLKRIFDFTHQKINSYSRSENTDVLFTLRKRRGNELARARVMISLCRKSQIPARLVTGYILQKQKVFRLYHWVETFQNDQWTPHDPEKGHFSNIPITYVPTRLDIPDIIRTSHPLIDLEIDLTQDHGLINLGAKKEKQITDIFDLTRLELDTRNTLAILLLLPLGALITAFFRHVVGLRSYGIFTPPLLALAVLYSDPVTTTATFLIVAIISITGRSFLPDNMSRSPRLTIVYTLVAISMVLSVSILEYFKVNIEGHAILLPIVILATLVDRIYSTLDDNGINIAMRRLGWTIFIAFFCFFVLRLEWLGQWLVRYPEFHLFTLAATLWFPLYNGKTCAQLKHCKWMAEPAAGKKPKSNSLNKTD
jgi:hypothetical protein